MELRSSRRFIFRSVFGIAVRVCVLTLLAVVSDARPLDRVDKSTAAKLYEEMRHQPLVVQIPEEIVDRNNDCWYSRAEIPILDPNSLQMRNLKISIARPVNLSSAPAVIVVPTIEGHTVLESRMASSLCDNGLVAIVADVNNVDQPLRLPGWGLEDENFRWAIHALRTVVDFAQTHPSIERGKVGVLGGSLGGITAGMLAGVENRLKAIAIIVGGGNLPSILSYSQHRKVVRWRERRMQNLGLWDNSQYEEILRTKIRHDPLHFVDRVDSNRMMMILARGDTSVIEENQVEYWQAAKKPQAYWTRGGHVATLIRTGYLSMDEISAFYIGKFNESENQSR